MSTGCTEGFPEESTHTNNQDPVPAAEVAVPGLESGVEKKDQGSQLEKQWVVALSSDEGSRKSAASGDAAAEAAAGDGAEAVVSVVGTTPFYLSRTFWVNAVALLSLLFPEVRVWLEGNPVEFATALGAVNVLLRFVTVGKYCVVSTESSLVPQPGRGQSCDGCTSSIGDIGDSALGFVLFLGMAGLMWGCSAGGDERVSVVAMDGRVAVCRGDRSLVFDRSGGVLSWSQTSAVTGSEPVVVEVGK